MANKTFRCAGGDSHFVSIYPDAEMTCVVIEDYWRGRSLVDRIKTAMKILFHGISDYSEILLDKRETIALGIYLFECANKMGPPSKDGQVVHDVPMDAVDLYLLGMS